MTRAPMLPSGGHHARATLLSATRRASLRLGGAAHARPAE